jgi:type IV secretory pathway TrbF-like protein
MKQRIHLERAVEVVLAIKDGDANVVALVEEFLKNFRSLDLDRLVATLRQLRAYSG